MSSLMRHHGRKVRRQTFIAFLLNLKSNRQTKVLHIGFSVNKRVNVFSALTVGIFFKSFASHLNLINFAIPTLAIMIS